MDSPLMLVFLIGFLLGMMTGIYLGNKKVRQSINGMFRSGDDDDDDFTGED